MLFAITAYFKLDAEVERQRIHERYNEHLMQRTDRVRLAGPLYDAAGKRAGMMLIVEADDFGGIQAFVEASPYAQAGLYARTEICELRPEVGSLG